MEDKVEKIKKALRLATASIPKLLKKRERELKKDEAKLAFLTRIAKALLAATALSGFAAFVLAFRYPQYASFLIPFSLVAMIFLTWFENLWIKNLQERLRDRRKEADPATAHKVMAFLQREAIAAHLSVLFDPPSFEEEYQKRYIDMIVDLGASCHWLEDRTDLLEAKRDAMYTVLDDAYSAVSKVYEEPFLREWRELFEKTQNELNTHFGHTLDKFCLKTEEDHAYIIYCFEKFLTSNAAKQIQTLIKMG